MGFRKLRWNIYEKRNIPPFSAWDIYPYVKEYLKVLLEEQRTTLKSMKKLFENEGIKIKRVEFVSNKFNNLRKIFGKYLASEVILVGKV